MSRRQKLLAGIYEQARRAFRDFHKSIKRFDDSEFDPICLPIKHAQRVFQFHDVIAGNRLGVKQFIQYVLLFVCYCDIDDIAGQIIFAAINDLFRDNIFDAMLST